MPLFQYLKNYKEAESILELKYGIKLPLKFKTQISSRFNVSTKNIFYNPIIKYHRKTK